MRVFVFALAMFASVWLCAGETAKGDSDKVVQINAEKLVLNVSAPGFEGTQAPDSGKPAQTQAAGQQPLPLFSGDFMKTLDTLAAWDGFRPWKIIYFVCGFLVSLLVSRGIRWLIENYLQMKIAKRTESELDDLFCMALGRPASLLTFTGGLYVSCLPVLDSMAANIHGLCNRLFLAFAAAAVAWAAYRMVEVLDKFLMQVAAQTDNNLDDLIVGIIRKIVKVCIVFVSVLFIGQNILGLNITTLLAGAGVAGLAIAFAAQDTIANFFGSLMIIIDQPFTVGDYVKIDAYEGTIERVGLRSSALRTPNGHLITIPNKLAANCSIENISRRPFLFKDTNIALGACIGEDAARKAVKIIEDVYKDHEGMKADKPPRVYLNELKDNCFNIRTLTWYHPADYHKHQEWLTATNFKIIGRLAEAGIKLSSQAETTYVLAGDPSRDFKVSLNSRGEQK